MKIGRSVRDENVSRQFEIHLLCDVWFVQKIMSFVNSDPVRLSGILPELHHRR